MNILILAAEYAFANHLRNLLEENNYQAHTALIGHSDLTALGTPDLVIAELSRDDYNLLLQIQSLRWNAPLIIFSNELQAADRVFCIERGAVYFMHKQFEPGELLAYLNNIKNHRQNTAQLLRFGNTALDPESCQLLCGTKSVRLSSREFHVMHILLQAKPRIVPKQELLTRVWGSESAAVENHVEVYIGFLRKKLLAIDSDIHISTARRMGYHLDLIHNL